MSRNGLLYLTKAKEAYSMGNIKLAKDYANKSIPLIQNKQECFFEYFDGISLLQSIASIQGDLTRYQVLEPLLKDCTTIMFQEQAPSYYALHQYDTSEFYGNIGLLTDATILINKANTLLMDTYGENVLLQFMYHHYYAKLNYHMEDFYNCIEHCLEANRLWVLVEENTNEDHAFLNMLYSGLEQVNRTGITNLILLASSYGKLNNCQSGIEILQNLKTIDITDYYLKSAIDLNLAELYSRMRNFPAVLELIRPYQDAKYDNHPDLAACIDTINFIMYFSTGLDNQAIELMNTRIPLAETISNDYIKVHQYNLALALIEQKNYQESLSLISGIGDKGYSLKMTLSSELHLWDNVKSSYEKVCNYYLNEIQNIFLHYNERLVYNHLIALEYHLSLCLGAFIECNNTQGESIIPAGDIYNFCLNIKGISLEGSYVIRHYPDPKSLKKRGLCQVEDIQNSLADNTLLLDYCILRTLNTSYYGVFLVSKKSVTCIKLSEEDELNKTINEYRLYLSTPELNHDDLIISDDVTTLETKLRRTLILPIRKHLSNYQHIIVAPASELFHLPFEMLTTSHDKKIGESHDITYVNMGRELTLSSLSKETTQDLETLVIGNPSSRIMADLPFAETEAKIVSKKLNTCAYLGDYATHELLLERSPTIELLHIASHCISPICNTNTSASMDNGAKKRTNNIMKECGLLLANDYLLTADEISSLPLSSVNLCVLSACDSGLGNIESYEGSFGIRRAFYLAGCKSLLVGLWKINDLSSMLFFTCYYDELVEKHASTLDALNRAKQILRNRTVAEWKPFIANIQKHYDFQESKKYFQDILNQHDSYIPFRHPYFWAGFILIS